MAGPLDPRKIAVLANSRARAEKNMAAGMPARGPMDDRVRREAFDRVAQETASHAKHCLALVNQAIAHTMGMHDKNTDEFTGPLKKALGQANQLLNNIIKSSR